MSFTRYLPRFLFAGGLATAIHYAVMLALISGQIPATLATAIGAAIGALSNYFLQFHWALALPRGTATACPATALPACWVGP